jgi:hypothetical protein
VGVAPHVRLGKGLLGLHILRVNDQNSTKIVRGTEIGRVYGHLQLLDLWPRPFRRPVRSVLGLISFLPTFLAIKSFLPHHLSRTTERDLIASRRTGC